MSEERRKQKMVVAKQEAVFTKHGGGTLYEVTAYDENGREIPDLRTFSELPTGTLQEYELKRYDHPTQGTTWTILAPSAGTSKRLTDVEAGLRELQGRVEDLEARLGEPEHHPIHPAQSELGDGSVRGPSHF